VPVLLLYIVELNPSINSKWQCFLITPLMNFLSGYANAQSPVQYV